MSAHFFDFKGEMLSPLGEDRCHCSRMPWGDSATAKFVFFSHSSEVTDVPSWA